MRVCAVIGKIALLCILVWSCKEDEDLDRPRISFVEPAANTVFDLPDTIKVVADIQDDRNLVSIILDLADENGTPVIVPDYFYPGTRNYKLTAYQSLTDKTLPSGNYWLTITASDGQNSNREYRPVIIHEIPPELEGFIAITAYYPFESTILRLDPQFNRDTSFVFPKGFHLSGFSGLWEQFYFVSSGPSVLYAFNAHDFKLLYDFPAWLPRPEFSALLNDRQLLFSTMSGDAGILNSLGQIIVKTQPQPGRTIQCFAADDSYLYAEMVSLGGDVREMTAFYRITGAIRAQRLVQDDIVGLQPLRDKALMISDSPGLTIFSEFDPENIKITMLDSYARFEISSTLKLNEDDILIFAENNVLLYEYDVNQLSEYLPGGYDFGRYDHLDDRLFLVKDSLVEVISAVSGYPVTISFDEPIMDFHLLFNKK